jgi:glycine betaine/choline ABC-type transport system substrate-binding protein
MCHAMSRRVLIVDFPVNPRMVSLDLVELRDTRHFFAPYFAAPVVSGHFLAEHPRLERSSSVWLAASTIGVPRA